MKAILNDYDIETLCQISGKLQAMALAHNGDPDLVNLISASARTLNPLFDYNDNETTQVHSESCNCRGCDGNERQIFSAMQGGAEQ